MQGTDDVLDAILGRDSVWGTLPLARSEQDQRRGAVLTATRQLFRESGPRNVTVRKIADRSGCSAPTIYSLVGGRDHVLENALLQSLDGCIAVAPSIARHNGINPVLALGDAFWAATVAEPAFGRHQLSLIHARPEGRRLSRLFSERTASAIAGWIDALAPAPASATPIGGLDAARLGQIIDQGFRAAAMDWHDGRSNLTGLRRDFALSAAATLTGFVDAEEQGRMASWVAYLQRTEADWRESEREGESDLLAGMVLS